MSKILKGVINLSRIPKQLIRESKKGEKLLFVDIKERKTPSKYGDTHSLSIWDKDLGTIYIGDFKVSEIGSKAESKLEPTDDLPF